MKITLPKYASNYSLCPFKDESEIKQFNMSFNLTSKTEYAVYWGIRNHKLNVAPKFGVMETGYFNNASFIDTIGSYENSSLNTKYGYDQIVNFDLNGRKSARSIIESLPSSKQSKFNANHGVDQDFQQRVILACQNPTDRSITYPHDEATYWKFVEGCCRFYGPNLYLKLHPWNSNEKAEPFIELAKKYRCGIGKFPIKLLKNKAFVIAFNSTIAIDCILLGVPYVQYAVGTFWNTFGVHFSNYSFPKDVRPIEGAEKLADFLIYKYCFNKGMSKEKYAKMIEHYSKSKDIFPLNDEFCYANNIDF